MRRPTRGIEVKEPTYSYMKIVDRFGLPVMVRNSSEPHGWGMGEYTANYLVQSLTYSRAEKMQIVETFGENFVFMYGERPIQAQVTGGLLNTLDFTWTAEFWKNYQEAIRGTKLAERGARLYLYVDGMLLEGLAMSANDNRTADQPNVVPFNMAVLVTSIQYLDHLSADFPIRSTAVQDVTSLTDVAAWGRLMTMSQEERSKYLAQSYGVRSRQVTEARYRRQKAMQDTVQGLGMLFESAMNGPNSMLMFRDIVDPSFLEALDPPPAALSRMAVERRTPLRGRIIDNLDEYVQGAPGGSGSSSPVSDAERARQLDSAMDQPEAAETAGMHLRDPEGSAFDQGPPDPPEADEAMTTLPEAVGADPGDDVPSGSGVLEGRDIPASMEAW